MGLIPQLPGEISGYLTNFGTGNLGGYATIFGWIMILAVIGAAFYAVYYFMSFPIKVTLIPLYGSGGKGELAVGKQKTNRYKWNNGRTAWLQMFPLFSRREIEPFDAKYLYPGNRVYAFKLGDDVIPGCLNISVGENKKIQSEINPVPHAVRAWQSLQYKKNAEEFSKKSFWDENKYFILGVITVAICCGIALATVWLTYKYAGSGRADIQMLTDAIKNFGTIPGIPPA